MDAGPWTSDNVMTRRGGRDDQILAARDELFKFAETTLATLIREEKRSFPFCGYLGIELLCRMDISVIDNTSGGLDYFVNEVERGATMTMYPNEWPYHWIDRLADNLAIDIPR